TKKVKERIAERNQEHREADVVGHVSGKIRIQNEQQPIKYNIECCQNQQKRKIIQRKNPVVVIKPFLFAMENPQEKCKEREIKKQSFGQVVYEFIPKNS